jgi:hypothetical protein
MRHRKAPIEKILLKVVSVTRKILIEINAYFLVLIKVFGKLVSFGYNLPEPSTLWVSPVRLVFVFSCSGEKFHSRNMESGRVIGA